MLIQVRSYKWPNRLKSVAQAHWLGKDTFGHWLGVRRGAPWWTADGVQAGVFERPLVKLVPSTVGRKYHDRNPAAFSLVTTVEGFLPGFTNGAFWTACFHPVDPVIDVDIVLPVQWFADTLEEVDLELDILRTRDGHTQIRDQDVFARVRKAGKMPDSLARQALATCHQVYTLVERGIEPFGTVGLAWLDRLLDGPNADGGSLKI